MNKTLSLSELAALQQNMPQVDFGQATNLPSDPRVSQLLALFQMSDERGKVTLLAIAGIHAARYPAEKKA